MNAAAAAKAKGAAAQVGKSKRQVAGDDFAHMDSCQVRMQLLGLWTQSVLQVCTLQKFGSLTH